MPEIQEAQSLLEQFRDRCTHIALVCVAIMAALGLMLAVQEHGITHLPLPKLVLSIAIISYALVALVGGAGSSAFECSAIGLSVLFIGLCWNDFLTVGPDYTYLYTPAVMLFIALHCNRVELIRRRLLYGAVLGSLVLALFFAPLASNMTIARIIVISLVVGGLTETLLKHYFAVLDQLQRSAERQRELFAIVGHELRTPTAAVVMTAQDESQDERIRLKQIQDTAQDLLSVMEDMRMVVAPKRAVEIKDTVEKPADVIRRAIDQLRPMADEAGIELIFKIIPPESGELSFRFSAQALRQLAVNGIKNAIVHSGGRRIQVTLSLGPNEASNQVLASLIIEDDGRGLGAFAQDLFEPFRRGRGQQTGSGLGLFIMQQLADRLSGTLSYGTSDLGGARFSVKFPISVAKVEDSSSEASADERVEEMIVNKASVLSGKQLVLAEDDRLLGELTKKLLESKGASVRWAKNGREALEAIQKQAPDLVLTDYFMPEMNGRELIEALNDEGRAIPSVALTAAVVGAERNELLAAGADAVLAKPLNVAEIEVIVDDIWRARPQDAASAS